MTRHKFKKNEESILYAVYDAQDLSSVQPSESPDFVLRRPYCETEFGVEITQFHLSESSARLRYIPGYVGEIIKGKYRHGKDKLSLKVDDVLITPRDNEVGRSYRAVIQQLPGASEHVRLIAECLHQERRHFALPRRLHL